MALIHTTIQRRGYLSRQGYVQLDVALLRCANLYNAALQEWRDAYSRHVGWNLARDAATNKPLLSRDGTRYLYNEVREKREGSGNVSLYSQYRELTAIRKDDDYWAGQDVGIARVFCKDWSGPRTAFFKRVKAGEKPGYPRFKSGRRWRYDRLGERPAQHGQGQQGAGQKACRRSPLKACGLPPSTDLKALKITRAGRRVTVRHDLRISGAGRSLQLDYNPAFWPCSEGIIRPDGILSTEASEL